MSDDGTTEKKPTPVMVPIQEIADLIVECAKSGFVNLDGILYSSITLIESRAKTNPTSLYRKSTDERQSKSDEGVFEVIFPLIGLMDGLSNSALGNNKVCTMVVLNMLDVDLQLNGNTVNGGEHYGIQTLYPAELSSEPGVIPEIWINEDTLPKAKTISGETTYGMGVYRFEKNLDFLGFGVHGTSGVISFKGDGLSDDVAAGWLVPYTGDKSRCAVSASPSKWGGLASFYDRWIDPDKERLTDSSSNSEIEVIASMQTWGGMYTGDDDELSNMVMTVVIRKAKN